MAGSVDRSFDPSSILPRGSRYPVGETHKSQADATPHMVSKTTRDEMTWYECEHCGLLFDSKEDARQHEQNCDAEEPSYIQ